MRAHCICSFPFPANRIQEAVLLLFEGKVIQSLAVRLIARSRRDSEASMR